MNDSRPRVEAICPEPQNYSDAGLAEIRKLMSLTSAPMTQEELARRIPAFDVLFVRLQTMVSRELLQSGVRLRAVVSPTTGLNHIDLNAAEELGIAVFHLKGQTEFLRSIPSTAEHTWALLLALVRRLPSAFDAVRAGIWNQETFRGHELQDKRLGILGCGRLGTMVAHYGHAFGMQVSAFDPYAPSVPSFVERCARLEDLLVAADVLSIHVPLNEETAGMIGEVELRQLRYGSFLINTSRGEIIDEEALVRALDSGSIAGAAVDVIQHELAQDYAANPLIAHAREHANLIITPHIGGATVEAVEKTDRFVIAALSNWLASTPPNT